MPHKYLEHVRRCAAAHDDATRLVTHYGEVTAAIIGRMRYTGAELSAFENCLLVIARRMRRIESGGTPAEMARLT